MKSGLFILGICTLLYAYFIEPNWIEIKSLQLTLPHLPQEFNEYRIVQISDIHVNRWMTSARLKRIFRLVNQQNPDSIVITGDLVTHEQQRFIPKLRQTLGILTAKDGKFGVLGNHDYGANPKAIAKTMSETGVINLNNTYSILQRGTAKLYIAGVDDVWFQKARLDLVLQNLPLDGAAILLAHEPDFGDTSAATNRFDLQLSGHSHAGQIRLPFLKPPVLPSLGKKYYAGLYQLGGMKLYTNRGIGMTGLHVRFNCRPEITVITLYAEKIGNG
ncbi:serine/threonine protein phosphatase [Calothrix sp. HK-06]|nr:serine/threonine protein phosphatase [Calothrix sp. HK-06]